MHALRILGRPATSGISYAILDASSSDMPSPAENGFRGCGSGGYLRKHNPWVNFGALPASTNRPFHYIPERLPQDGDVSFVSPNMCHDMRDCSIRTGDRWIRTHFSRCVRWALAHNGANVRPGVQIERLDHNSVLRTIEDAY
jgi:phosphatidylinositol-3-phosphatase